MVRKVRTYTSFVVFFPKIMYGCLVLRLWLFLFFFLFRRDKFWQKVCVLGKCTAKIEN